MTSSGKGSGNASGGWVPTRATEEFLLEPDPSCAETWSNGCPKTMLLTTAGDPPRLRKQLVRVNHDGVPLRSSMTHLGIAGVPQPVPGPGYARRNMGGGAAWREGTSADRSRSAGCGWSGWGRGKGGWGDWDGSASGGWGDDRDWSSAPPNPASPPGAAAPHPAKNPPPVGWTPPKPPVKAPPPVLA